MKMTLCCALSATKKRLGNSLYKSPGGFIQAKTFITLFLFCVVFCLFGWLVVVFLEGGGSLFFGKLLNFPFSRNKFSDFSCFAWFIDTNCEDCADRYVHFSF